MNIVIIGCRNIENVGGIESYMLDICSCYVKEGHKVYLYTGSRYNKKEVVKGINICNIKVTQNKYFNKLSIGLKSTIRAIREHNDVDIYHFNANIAGIFSIIPIVLHKNVVFQGHGFEWKRAKWNSLIRFVDRVIDLLVILVNKNIIMCSEEQIKYIHKYFKNKNIMYAPGGVFLPPQKPIEDHYLGKKFILFLGRIVPEKRLDLLLEAYIKIQNDTILDLYIAGPCENSNIVEKYLNYERIKFLGAQKGDYKYSLLSNCSIYVLPSDLEGLSISLLEAMSYGKICLVSNIKANCEALCDAGVYFDAGKLNDITQKLLLITANYKKYEKYGNQAKEIIKNKFEWSILATNLIKYYKRVSIR